MKWRTSCIIAFHCTCHFMRCFMLDEHAYTNIDLRRMVGMTRRIVCILDLAVAYDLTNLTVSGQFCCQIGSVLNIRSSRCVSCVSWISCHVPLMHHFCMFVMPHFMRHFMLRSVSHALILAACEGFLTQISFHAPCLVSWHACVHASFHASFCAWTHVSCHASINFDSMLHFMRRSMQMHAFMLHSMRHFARAFMFRFM